jgi:hypothetical protein
MSVSTVDGTSLQANKAVFRLMCEVLRLAATPAR